MNTKDSSRILYDSITINRYSKFEEWIDDAKIEDMYLECKSPSGPKINSEKRATLAIATSGFSNTNGGVLVYGLSTIKKDHGGLDVINQIEPIGNIRTLEMNIRNQIPLLTTPSISNFDSKVIKRRRGDTKGLAVVHIPKFLFDPVQSIVDNRFYFRTGDEFRIAPYEMIKRLFASTETPNLSISIEKESAKKDTENVWEIPVVIENDSSAIGSHVTVQIYLKTPDQCQTTNVTRFKDLSAINFGNRIWSTTLTPQVIHKGLPVFLGTIKLGLKPRKKKCTFEISIFANKMRAKKQNIDIIFNKKSIQISYKSI